MDTLIIFFSDHGDMHGSHGLFHKTNPYEESVGLVELVPTTLGLCDLEPPGWMHGKNLTHFYSQQWNESKPESYEAVLLQVVIPTGHGDSTDRAWRGVVTRDGWKYVCFENQDWLMFDHKTDPLEQVNLAHNSRFSQERKRLRGILVSLLEAYGDSFPVPE